MSSVGQRISALRRTRNLSQAEFARLTESSPVDVFRWEKQGRVPDSFKLVAIADALDTSTDYLLGRVNDSRTLTRIKEELVACVVAAG